MYSEFELDLTDALRRELPLVLDALDGTPLTQANVSGVPQTQGVYMLLEGSTPMYVGKTDAAHGFQDRLKRHCFTLSARKNIDLANVFYKAVRVMVFTTVNVEAMLIERYIDANPMAWQNSGFGSNDPGHRRELQDPSKFDIDHPINIRLPVDFVPPGSYTALELLLRLKHHLPYDLRYQTDPAPGGKSHHFKTGHADQRDTTVHVPSANLPVRDLLELVVNALPHGWVVTVFPGRVILYKEPTSYRFQLERLVRS